VSLDVSFILVKVTLTVLLCVAVNIRSRLNDINITEHYLVAFNALKMIDYKTIHININSYVLNV